MLLNLAKWKQKMYDFGVWMSRMYMLLSKQLLKK